MQSQFAGTVRVIDSATECPDLPIVVGTGSAKAIVWPGRGVQQRSMHVIRMGAGAHTIDLLHPSDCVYYVLAGSGSIEDVTSGEVQPLREGAMVHIDAGDTYRLRADAADFSVLGGPCPADPALYAHIVEG